ncbi:prephenate dehydrogenase [Caldalkalibacillus uzonensis]|uniref:Prephenate dehydrogenase n=1 Tax=Caldalkalibacillus uzonensis TaxID=353224 RepID=A0ABU0CMJ1_9BACI|nr:prephenate dehydrogenase [Caldalkalibacillus uzonensis]MDQ0337644.1 prephenate dehydrogenase [Caldalkalibacillus uzonensis]
MKRIAIIGIGLIGGSIALSIKKHDPNEVFIQAYDLKESQLQLARALGVIDHGTTDLDKAVAGADVVFICTPVQSVCHLLEPILLSPALKEDAIVTDVGSTKMKIVQRAQELSARSKGVFIGGHPMAGSHKSGVEAATERLFENAYYVLTPSEETEDAYTQRLKALLASTRAKVVEMKPDEHDRVVGAISHFPHVIASALVEHVYQYQQESEWYLRLAAGGFRDITRIASSNPKMWRDIVLSNHSFIVQQMKDWLKQMEHVLDMIDSGDEERIEHFFRHAKEVRDGLPDTKRGAIPSFYDLYVDIPDHPGVIGQVTTLLGIHQISITNIAILETREDIMGVLRLTFRHECDLEKAEKVLRDANFPVYRRD